MHKLKALLAAFVLLFGLGLFAAAPASAHSTFDVSPCGASYVLHGQLFAAGGNGTVTWAMNPNTGTYCFLGFAIGNDHGVSHYMRVRTHQRGTAYDGDDIDEGNYAHYVGPVKEGMGSIQCLDFDYRWTDPQTGSTYTLAFHTGELC